MRHLRLIITALCLLAIGGAAISADSPVPEKLSLLDAVSISLGENVSIKSASEGLLAAESRLRIADLDTSYTIGSAASLERTPDDRSISSRLFGRLDYRSLTGTEASLDLSSLTSGSENSSVGLTIRHPLMQGKGLLSERADLKRGAQNALSIRSKEVFMARQSTIRSVIAAYYRAVQAQEQVKVQERAIAIMEEVLRGTRLREEAGLVAGIEVSRAETNLAQANDRLNDRRQNARGALDQLMLAIGSGIGQTPELVDRVPNVEMEFPSLDEAIETALENRPELTVYDYQLADQERRLAMVRDELRPGLDAVARFNSSDNTNNLLSSTLFDQGYFTAGVEFRFPLDKREITERKNTTARNLNLMREQREYELEKIAEDVRSAYRALDSARTSLDIYTQNLDVAKEGLRIAQRMVEEGEGSNREVLDAQESLANTENGILSAKIDLYLAGVDLMYAMGENLTTMGPK